QVEDWRLGAALGGCGSALPAGRRIVACEREDVLDAERVKIVEALAQRDAVVGDAREMDVGGEAARARRGADTDGIVTHRAARVAGDRAGDDLGQAREARRDVEQTRFAREAGGDELDDVAEALLAQRGRERVHRRQGLLTRAAPGARGARPRPSPRAWRRRRRAEGGRSRNPGSR